MDIHTLLNPAPDALIGLRDDFTEFLIPAVRKIIAFGSLARGGWDGWSDIDLIVVTETRQEFVGLLAEIEKWRPIFHRNHFVTQVHPPADGAHVLGIIFEGASIFHVIDLNNLTIEEYQKPDALVRFGVTQELYAAPSRTIPSNLNQPAVVAETEDPAEVPLKVGIHFTKKAVKQILRGEPAHDKKIGRDEPTYHDLRHHSTQLKQAMAEFPADLVRGSRNVGRLAQDYIQIADYLLQQRE